MPYEAVLTFLLGVFIMIIGLLVFKKKALFLINLVLWNGVTGDETLLSRIFGTIFIMAGLIVVILPFVL
ncbi:hypothetical protein [Cytobacillus gottheilii]|uniref:hypothetical protein n=1 Tax=Cytobacillus gottheilii TaxID=859144 RepID=UPI0009B9ADFC|nr:hypothetical protein [Cytobacillus gottheilii]